MTLYFFGKLSNGYSQYPFDFTSDVLDKLISNAKAPTQIITHRSNNLMYYSYIRKLEGNKYIGICCLWNDRYTEKISELFKLFENTFDKLANKGSIIYLTNNGKFDSSLIDFRLKTEDINDTFNSIQYKLDVMYAEAKPLPPTEYSVSKNSIQSYSIKDDASTIIKATYTYGYTYIYKDEDYDSVEMKRISNVVATINAKNEQLIEQNNQLKKQIEEVNAKKKQYKYVILLAFAIAFCGIGILYLKDDLKSTQNDLNRTKTEVIQKNNTIELSHDSIVNLTQSLQDKIEENQVIREQKNKAYNIYPIIISNININSSKISFDYYSPSRKDITISIVATNTNHSEVISNSHQLTFYEGGGKKELSFDRTLDSSDYYYVCVLYDGYMIAGKRW